MNNKNLMKYIKVATSLVICIFLLKDKEFQIVSNIKFLGPILLLQISIFLIIKYANKKEIIDSSNSDKTYQEIITKLAKDKTTVTWGLSIFLGIFIIFILPITILSIKNPDDSTSYMLKTDFITRYSWSLYLAFYFPAIYVFIFGNRKLDGSKIKKVLHVTISIVSFLTYPLFSHLAQFEPSLKLVMTCLFIGLTWAQYCLLKIEERFSIFNNY